MVQQFVELSRKDMVGILHLCIHCVDVFHDHHRLVSTSNARL